MEKNDAKSGGSGVDLKFDEGCANITTINQ